MDKQYRIGLDIGSTTIKTAVLDNDNNIIHSSYQRHYSDIKQSLYNILSDLLATYDNFSIMVTGSGGIGAHEWLGIPFIQEVIAGIKAIETYIPECDVAIELGGEDAKITYISGGIEQRMNGTCAGGTGAFIDQMAVLLATDASGLDELAKECKTIHPIASRCGVFAKSDVQPLINDGASKSDIAGSIFQSVVNQTISGLACGKPIRGKIAFLGGPLHFLSQLRHRFETTLSPDKSFFPENSQVFNALGSALSAKDDNFFRAADLQAKLDEMIKIDTHEVDRLPPLFNNEDELQEFRQRHASAKANTADLATHSGVCYLGIDAGSTTTKVVLINDNSDILYSWYGSNAGDPLSTIRTILLEIYDKMPPEAFIGHSTVTGYGESLIKAALGVDNGEIETMAHMQASNHFLDGVEFILDIGGQDMKCLRLKNGVIKDILLNEACSSGCGSFIETFATALSMPVADFATVGLTSKSPVDLGSKCTVFMNSRVKQAQKEGASVGDISAGLAYSVVKNALFKVIKLRDNQEMGSKIILQGGTFLNESVLRAFELTAGREVVRPNIAGLMGAYGCALISKTKHCHCHTSTLLSKDELLDLNATKKTARCGKCGNRCLLTINDFGGGKKYITNNRCEKGATLEATVTTANKTSNMFEYKYNRLFDYYKPRELHNAPRGRVGLPRVLNMYENYPFWFSFFDSLGYRVELSPTSSRAIYDLGIESMPSESVCYPAKISHGHIVSLLKAGHKFIFYPCIPYEIKEDPTSDNHYNCPVVGTYAEVIRNNMQDTFSDDVKFMAPFLPYNDNDRLIARLCEEFGEIPKSEIITAVAKGREADRIFKDDVNAEGKRLLDALTDDDNAIVLAGRPYHLDPEINHGIPEMIASYGFVVLTEDSVSRSGVQNKNLRVYDQWMYHSRLYTAANYAKTRDNIDLIQLNSFGCGLDAITTDQVHELLSDTGKLYTVLKIDEVSNLGAARIRLRSLMAVLSERKDKQIKVRAASAPKERVLFTEEMRKTYKIIAPNISPIHLELLEPALKAHGYDVDILPCKDESLDVGLKYVNNDSCYPTILTLGSVMEALQSGKYDVHKTAILLTQTGGGCRATNYIPMLRRSLSDADLDFVPIISLNFEGLEKNPGFVMKLPMLTDLLRTIIYGDLLMQLLYATRPYEINKGEAQKIYTKWHTIIRAQSKPEFKRNFKSNIQKIVKEFDSVAISDVKKPKVGLVGEILVKFHPQANNQIIELIEKEGGEAVMPGLLDFFMFCTYNNIIKHSLLDGSRKKRMLASLRIYVMNRLRSPVVKALTGTRFAPPLHIKKLADKASTVVSLGNINGEGWFLTAEMLELIHSNINNIVCMQPFACLPNHVTGKGVMKEIKLQYPQANIVAVDYDPGSSEVNQINRIKLMLSVAFKNLEQAKV